MALMKWNPYREVSNWQREWNRMMDETFGSHGTDDYITGNWAPRVNILEDENSILVETALPGMSQEDIKVSVDNNTLTVSGERKLESEEKRAKYTRMEQFYGTFTRSFTLPNTIDTGKIEAKMDKGILTVTLPKREETKPRSIEVKIN